MMNPACKSWHFFLCVATLCCCFPFTLSLRAEVVRTGYTQIVTSSSGKCLDITGGSQSAGAQAIQWPCSPENSTVNQSWTVVPAGSGSSFGIEIVEQGTGQCLDVAGGSTALGGSVVQNPCTGSASQFWRLNPIGTSFQLVNNKSGLCADVAYHTVNDGNPINQNTCATTPTFLWIFSSGLYTPASPTVVLSAQTGLCLNVVYGGTYTGEQVSQYPCEGATNEQWYFKPFQNGYQIISVRSGLCFAAEGNQASPSFVQDTCTSDVSDLWRLLPAGGSYQFSTMNGGQCLNNTGGLGIAPCSSAQSQTWSLSSAAMASSWSSVINLTSSGIPVDPIAVANLPNGTLLTWSAYDPFTYESNIGLSSSQTYSSIFDPVALTTSETLVTNTGADMFCPGTANLANGNILVNGGSSSPKTEIFSPFTGNWTADALMNIPRGYEGTTALPNGGAFTLGGSWTSQTQSKTGEIWSPSTGWTVLTGVPATNIVGPDPAGVYRGDNHLWLFTAPNGQIFHAGPSAHMNWITTSGVGSITSAGNRGDDQYSINGSAVMYDTGMIMKAGGATAYDNGTAETNAYTININNGTNVVVNKIAPMMYPRTFSNGVVLPNGQVVIVGGQTLGVPFSDSNAILIPELWDPNTQIFRQLSPMQTPRVYHSTAILLKDGRIFVGGGGQCGNGCSANHFTAEILTPPYLLNADGSAATRPVISSAPAKGSLGSQVNVVTSSAVASFVLMRLSSVTHTVNNDQRRIPVQIGSGTNGSYNLNIPSNSGVVLPGYYWIFALNAQGVPSVGSTILLN